MTAPATPPAWMPWRPSAAQDPAADPRPRDRREWATWAADWRQRATTGAGSTTWRVLAVLAVLLAAGLHVWVALGAVTPTFPFDEITLLEYARYYATGGGEITPIEGVGYFPAWALVLAPLWWVIDDPGVFYQVVIWLGVAVAIATIWPLSAALRRFGLAPAPAVALGALVMCQPSRVVQADYTMSEKPLFLVLACVMVAALRMWERPTVPRAAVFALLAVLAGFMHSRATVMLIACVIWLLLFALRNWRASLVGLVVAAPLGWLSYRYSIGLNDLLLQSHFNQGTNLTENLTTARPSIILRVILGQTWNQTVATLGVYLIGVVVVLCLIGLELRRFRAIGPACLLGAMFLGIFVVSVASWSSEQAMYFAEWRRLDAWLYGRYIEPVTALIVAAGLAALVRGLRPTVLAVSAAATAVVLAATVLWVAPGAPTWAYVTPAHLGGVMPWYGLLPDGWDDASWPYGTLPSLTNLNRFWAIASLTTVIGMGLLVAASLLRLRPTVPVAALLAAAAVGTVAADTSTDVFQEVEGGIPPAATQIEAIQQEHGPQEIDFDRSCTPMGANNNVVQNNVSYWIQPSTMDVVFSPADIDADLVVSCGEWPEAEALGALPVAGEATDGYRVWVLPGELQEELAAEGALG